VRRRRPVEDLESLLDNICGQVDCGLNPLAKDEVTIRELLATVGRRSYGPLLLIVGLFSISPATIVPGMTWLSAGLTLVIALQMFVGRRTPWLPRHALDASISRELVLKGVSGFRPWAHRIDAMMRPRLSFLANPPFVNLIAIACVITALVTIPLGFIPFAPLAPGIAIVMFGLGMTSRDGLLLTFALIVVAAACYFAWPILGPFVMPAVRFFQGLPYESYIQWIQARLSGG
jgi:hypothetical protein